jgi:autotransporter-associated beta strand protein
MAFIGTPLDTRNTFQSLQGKRFNGDGSTTAFTLDVAPSSTLDIEVFVGNVRQDPNSAYTLSGTTLTFTGAPPSGTNNIYVVHQAKSVGTIDPPATETIAKTFSGNVTMSGTNTLSGATTVSGALTASGGATISGTTPTLTIGDAGAEDTKIVFDGNAQDYHIGLDDSSDDLVIGKGSALGTTAHIVTDENGHVTMPLQSAFSAQCNAELSNVPNDNSVQTVKLGTEIFDLNADYNTSTFTFTAPVTGKYLLTFSATLANVDSDATYIAIFIDTSNRNYQDSNTFGINGYGADEPRVEVSQTVVADMDASDTAKVSIKQFQGTAQMDVQDDTCHFSGHLVC